MWPALAISLVLHGLVLWSVHPEMPVGEVVRRLEATLRPAAVPAAPVAESKEVHPPSAKVRRETPARPEVITAPESTAAARQETPRKPPVADSTTEPVQRSAPDPSPRPIPSPGDSPSAQSAAPPAAAIADGANVDGIRQYRLSLAAQARRFKLYPARAMEGGMSGTAEVRVTIGPSGFPQEVRLVKTSGHDLLDETALDMIRKAAPRTSIPEPLRGRTFVVSLPVVFDLSGQ